MSFDCSEFKEIADKIQNFKSLPNEGRYRTAIGRYYYFIFLKIRDTIYGIDEREEIKKYYFSGLIHKFIRLYLFELSKIIGNRKLIRVANKLKKLHNLRKKSDYNIGDKINTMDVKDAKKYVDDILYLLNTVEFQGVVGFENILKHLKKIGEEEREEEGDEYKYFPRINQLG